MRIHWVLLFSLITFAQWASARSEQELIICRTSEFEVLIRAHILHAYDQKLRFVEGDYIEVKYQSKTHRFENILTSTDGAGNFRFQAFKLEDFEGAKEVLNLYNDHEGATIEGYFTSEDPDAIVTNVPLTEEACEWLALPVEGRIRTE